MSHLFLVFLESALAQEMDGGQPTYPGSFWGPVSHSHVYMNQASQKDGCGSGVLTGCFRELWWDPCLSWIQTLLTPPGGTPGVRKPEGGRRMRKAKFYFQILWLRRKGGGLCGAQKIFRAMELFCMRRQRRVLVIPHLPKPKECASPGVNPNANYGHWVITMCHWRFLKEAGCNKSTTVVPDDGRGKVVCMCVHARERKREGGALPFALSFAVNLNLF